MFKFYTCRFEPTSGFPIIVYPFSPRLRHGLLIFKSFGLFGSKTLNGFHVNNPRRNREGMNVNEVTTRKG